MSAISGLIKMGGASAEINEPATLPNSQIRADGGTQMREAMNDATITEYTGAWQDGAQFPPVTVFVDANNNYWLGDGFHRLASHIDAFGPGESIAVELRDGTQREAILYAAKANATHGLPRTNADKLKAVYTLLRDAEWRLMSDNQIAAACAVSQPFVSKHRKILESSGEIAQSMIRKTASGATMDTSKIGGAVRAGGQSRQGQTGGAHAKINGTYNDYKVEPTAPVYVSSVADAPTVDEVVPFDAEPETYNGYKADEARPLSHGSVVIVLDAEIAGEVLTALRQNAMAFHLRKSSHAATVAAFEDAMREFTE